MTDFSTFPSSHSNFLESNRETTVGDPGLRNFALRLAKSMERDDLVQQTTDDLRNRLQVDRVVLYYFYYPWKGQVTFESLSSPEFSIFGSSGPDECFNHEYAALYLTGRTRAIADIEMAAIHPCHRDFLRNLQVRANLVVPILIEKNTNPLWGLLIAHHCQGAKVWTEQEILAMKQAAQVLANAPSIQGNEP